MNKESQALFYDQKDTFQRALKEDQKIGTKKLMYINRQYRELNLLNTFESFNKHAMKSIEETKALSETRSRECNRISEVEDKINEQIGRIETQLIKEKIYNFKSQVMLKQKSMQDLLQNRWNRIKQIKIKINYMLAKQKEQQKQLFKFLVSFIDEKLRFEIYQIHNKNSYKTKNQNSSELQIENLKEQLTVLQQQNRQIMIIKDLQSSKITNKVESIIRGHIKNIDNMKTNHKKVVEQMEIELKHLLAEIREQLVEQKRVRQENKEKLLTLFQTSAEKLKLLQK